MDKNEKNQLYKWTKIEKINCINGQEVACYM